MESKAAPMPWSDEVIESGGKQIASEEKKRRADERSSKHRQTNDLGHTTMISPLARLLVNSLRGGTPTQVSAAKKFVRACLASADLVIIGKKSCPRCRQAEEFFVELIRSGELPQMVFQFYHLDELEASELLTSRGTTAAVVQDHLWDLTGCRTVPRVFVNGKSFGGFDDCLASSADNSLKSRVADALAGGSKGNSKPKMPHTDSRYFTVEILAADGKICRNKELQLPGNLSGLGLKSQVLSYMALPGSFSDYFLTAALDKDGNFVPIGSRLSLAQVFTSKIATEKKVFLKIRSRMQDEPKAIGHT